MNIVISCLVLLLVVGCKIERIPCDTGLDGKKTPPYFHIVERADEADTYTVSLMDERLTLLSESFEFQVNEGGQVMLPWPSCRDLDGFDEVRYLHIEKSSHVYKRVFESYEEECLGIPFVAQTDHKEISLTEKTKILSGQEELGRSGWEGAYSNVDMPNWYAGWDIYPFHSTLMYLPSFLREADQDRAVGKVLISGGLNMQYVMIPDQEDQPPHFLLRAWTFEDDAADKARETLGVDEIQDESFTCVDLYYGYFDNK